MEFSELLKNRRSVRVFQDKMVPDHLIMEILRDACLAPSAMNGQPWRFIVVLNKATIRRLSDESKKNLLAYLEEHPESPIRQYENEIRKETFNSFYNAPCLVLITGPSRIASLVTDCSLAACYFMLSATARGLGTCWIGLGAHILDKDLRKEIGLPETFTIVAPIICGYPASVPDIPERRPPQVLKVIPPENHLNLKEGDIP
jgi:nitroreductase